MSAGSRRPRFLIPGSSSGRREALIGREALIDSVSRTIRSCPFDSGTLDPTGAGFAPPFPKWDSRSRFLFHGPARIPNNRGVADCRERRAKALRAGRRYEGFGQRSPLTGVFPKNRLDGCLVLRAKLTSWLRLHAPFTYL